MKVARNGQAKVLDPEDLPKLFAAFKTERDKALFAICLFTGCRISEALALHLDDVSTEFITFKKATTRADKGEQKT